MFKKPSRSTSPLVVANPHFFTRAEIELYERHILDGQTTTEHDASHFFTSHPKFLLMGSGAEIRREVVLNSTEGKKSQRVDFFRRSFGAAHWDIVELKSPQKEFVVSGHKGHPNFSSVVYNAINQAEDYRDLIISEPDLRRRLLSLGIAVWKPQITVVVGKDCENVPDDVMVALYDRLCKGHVNVRNYNDIYRFAKEHYKSSMTLLTSTLLVESDRIARFGDNDLLAIQSETEKNTIISIGARRLVDSSTIEMFGDALIGFIERKSPSEIVLDLSETEFIASSLLNKLVRGHVRARKNGKELILTGLQPELRKMFKITRMDRFFKIENLKHFMR